MDNEVIQKLEEIRALLSTLVAKTDATNQLLRGGLKTQWGHNMSTLEMDPDRFKKSEEERDPEKKVDGISGIFRE